MVELHDGAAPLVRTWFDDDDAWARLIETTVTRAQERGDVAFIQVFDDRALGALPTEQIAALPRTLTGHTVALVADREAMVRPEQPLLVLRADGAVPPELMRIAAAEVAGFVINVHELANMDWEDFAPRVDGDGVFRGFGSR